MGSRKDIPNMRTQELFHLAEKLECNPFEILLYFAKGDYVNLDLPEWNEKTTKTGERVLEPSISPELRQKSAKDACEYLFPKRKAIEHTGETGGIEALARIISELSGTNK